LFGVIISIGILLLDDCGADEQLPGGFLKDIPGRVY
jgi:hypothetical protein